MSADAFLNLGDKVRGLFARSGRDAGAAEAVPVRDWVSTSAGQPTRLQGFDITLLWVVLAMMALGLLMVYSASIAMPDNPRFGNIEPYHFVKRHVISLFLGFICAVIAFKIPMNIWERYAPWLFVVSILLLAPQRRAPDPDENRPL